MYLLSIAPIKLSLRVSEFNLTCHQKTGLTFVIYIHVQILHHRSNAGTSMGGLVLTGQLEKK